LRRASKVVVSVALAATLLTSATACSLLPGAPAPVSSPTADGTGAASREALAAYVESERSQLTKLLGQYSSLYSDLTVDGAVEESTGDGDIPEGTYSVMTYTSTYANEMDWSEAGADLDEQIPRLDGACTRSIFPTMHTLGVEGPVAVVFEYGDVTADAQWTYTCVE